ncbi:MAG: ATP-dependent DNA helicase [Sandaracinus sp.]|nr:ATP-dependent DNA helicase [Sandaracinus sp.]MCB9618261.1 ATP-dependent DNA helicase [Sandaracinus sp.]
MRASELLGPFGPLARSIAGYEHRPSQMRMADLVEEALTREGVAIVEAGTGTGKTWAYLVPAILSGKRVVISTGTRALQDQIMERDLPALRDHLGLAVEAACMKGLSNYLCLRRYELYRRSPEAAGAEVGRQLRVIEDWKGYTETGDRADLPLAEDASVWSHVQSGPDTRIGARCSFFEQCFVTRMRRAAENARIVVVNHHLFFADLALRGDRTAGGAVLPDYDAVVFDEAHQLEETATLFFGSSVSTGQLERLARDATRSLTAARDGSPLPEVLRAASDAFFLALPRLREGNDRIPLNPSDFARTESSVDRDWDGKPNAPAASPDLERRFFALDDALEALGAHCRAVRGEDESLDQIAKRCGQIRDDLGRITEAAIGQSVAWVSRRGLGTALGISPVDVSAILRKELFGRAASVVLTSATLTTGRSGRDDDGPVSDFRYFKQRLGIEFEVDELALPSPFDFPSQAGLYVPEKMPDPRDPRFVDTAAKEILGLIAITDGGAFVLCTSFRNMHALAQACRPTLIDRGYPVLVQGELPKPTLLSKFRESGDAVLFATSSFWEGVDVPGHALRLVVIDKLPFEVPSDPLVRARCERLEEEGGKPFMELLVPAAALTLKQGFGRLIRTRKDRGIVTILDSRLVKKGYGKVFLRSLPDASRLYSLAEAKAFWENAREAAAAEAGEVEGNV